jgi:hypothetical protein
LHSFVYANRTFRFADAMTLRGSGDDGKRNAGTKSKFVLSTTEKSVILWDIAPCSPSEINRVSEEHVAPSSSGSG